MLNNSKTNNNINNTLKNRNSKKKIIFIYDMGNEKKNNKTPNKSINNSFPDAALDAPSHLSPAQEGYAVASAVPPAPAGAYHF